MTCPWCGEVAGATVGAVIDHFKAKHQIGLGLSVLLGLAGATVFTPMLTQVLSSAFGEPPRRRGGRRGRGRR